MEPIRLILFSGLAADAQVFAPQKLAFPDLLVPQWPTPLPKESLSAWDGGHHEAELPKGLFVTLPRNSSGTAKAVEQLGQLQLLVRREL